MVRVEARTRLSERFLFRLKPKITGLSTKCHVRLDLPGFCQFFDTISLIGGFRGLWVVMQKNLFGSFCTGAFVNELLSAIDFLR